jgi:hypothetical protein
MMMSLDRLLVLLLGMLLSGTFAFSVPKEIYGVPRSGWKSPDWNWGSAAGTGHDCALVCRQQYATRQARADLVVKLQAGEPEPTNFEEVKLVLALAWQQGRWNGSDGGQGGYSEVLRAMAEAERYEQGSEDECARRLVQDLQSRFTLLDPSEDQLAAMKSVLTSGDVGACLAQRRCSGLVLEAMDFIENGI